MKDRALVLGGGGPVGIAWEVGVAAGLEAEGVDVTKADFIVGTSAGSVVGSQLAGGQSPTKLAAAHTDYARLVKANPQQVGPPPNLMPLMQYIMRFPADGPPGLDLRKEIGAFALSAQTLPEEHFINQLSGLVKGDEWPINFACTAVDTESGEFQLWTAKEKVQLQRGVTSSCAVPGIYPPITINGRRWMDGGMRSGTNLDVVPGFKRVLCMAVVPAMAVSTYLPKIEREAQAIRDAGGKVEVIRPDEGSLAVFGQNLMDGSRREEIVEAGMAQGRREAGRLRAFWN